MLEPGTRIGTYEVVEAIGKGGMGEVYRARDEKLGRDVALKVLPAEFSESAERVARFEREARLLGSLNHPNIATLYGLEEHDGRQLLVMELVGGSTLDELGKLPLDEALPLFEQLAEGLAAAHDHGVLHRDLKPANIKVTPAAKIKILDFGLAKAIDAGDAEGETSDSPTRTKDTALGTVIGTAPYMSPEQARGKTVDKRTDVWAFGCCLYESLTGRRVFDGETVADIIGAITKTEPDMTTVPARARSLIERCLEKDVTKRLRDVGDARLLLVATPSAAPPASSRTWLVALGAAVLGAALAGVVLWAIRGDETPPVKRYVAAKGRFVGGVGTNLALSPDGSTLVYSVDEDGVFHLYSRPLDSVTATKLPGTEDGRHPAFSPDGSQLAFHAEEQIKKMPAIGGPPVVLTDIGTAWTFFGLTWESNDSILFGSDQGIMRLPASGDTPTQLTVADGARSRGHAWPTMVPEGRGVLFSVLGTLRSEEFGLPQTRLAVSDLEMGDVRVLLDEEAYNPVYSPTGHLLFVRKFSVMAVRFDSDLLRIDGAPVPILDAVERKPGGVAQLALAQDGTLAYMPQNTYGREHRLAWVDRDGNVSGVLDEESMITNFDVSPDGRRIAGIANSSIVGSRGTNFRNAMLGYTGASGIVIYDTERGTRAPFRPGEVGLAPKWSPDGRQIAFTFPSGEVATRWVVGTSPAGGDGTVTELIEGRYVEADAWTPDGSQIVVSVAEGKDARGADLSAGLAVVSSSNGTSTTFLEGDALEYGMSLSPDGELASFVSLEGGREAIHIATFPVPSRRWAVSPSGSRPHWSLSGKELYYSDGGKLFSVAVERGDELRLGRATVVFDDPSFNYASGWDLHPDGERFLINQRLEEFLEDEIHITLNWFQELERLVPMK